MIIQKYTLKHNRPRLIDAALRVPQHAQEVQRVGLLSGPYAK
jgi:hypothetical protein